MIKLCHFLVKCDAIQCHCLCRREHAREGVADVVAVRTEEYHDMPRKLDAAEGEPMQLMMREASSRHAHKVLQ
jgi:hypothetical protein